MPGGQRYFPTWLAELSGLHVSRIYQIHQKYDAELT
jgi:hypothetical protein